MTPEPPALPNQTPPELAPLSTQRTTINKAAIYVKEPARSHPDGADPARQMAEALEYCEARGLEAIALYQDNQGSREDFQRMISHATREDPPFYHVVVWKLMYFALRLEESIEARGRLKAHEIKPLSVKERQPGE